MTPVDAMAVAEEAMAKITIRSILERSLPVMSLNHTAGDEGRMSKRLKNRQSGGMH